jgi:hypothetical protein
MPKRKRVEIKTSPSLCIQCYKSKCSKFQAVCVYGHRFPIHRKCRDIQMQCKELNCNMPIEMILSTGDMDPFRMKRAKTSFKAWKTSETKRRIEKEVRDTSKQMACQQGYATEEFLPGGGYRFIVLDDKQFQKIVREQTALVQQRYFA